jgi:N-acetylglucosamine kinase-like BadF-type ATPase
MKFRSDPVKFKASTKGSARQMTGLALGVDGGGTKTRAVVLNGGQMVLGEGVAGPSNPLRVGVREATAAIQQAVDRACAEARVRRVDIVAAEIGLAGVRRADLRTAMRSALSDLGIKLIKIVTDSDIALYGATEGKPGLVIIAGTGSICCGRNASGAHICAGGWGPLAGDEGSGSWIARRGLQASAKATDGRGRETALVDLACEYFNIAAPQDLSTALYAPNMTNNRIAGFGKVVIEAAQSADEVAIEIVAEAGTELGIAACAVIGKLRMPRERFQIGYVGGVFVAGELILGAIREEIAKVAPRANLSPPLLAPAEAAARMAMEQARLALAG